jgi:hypothetical protein
LTTPPWSQAKLAAACARGSHKSATEYITFLQEEIIAMMQKGQWVLLPYHLVKHLPNLRLSPLGVVPQRDRRPRVIVDYTYSGVNDDTLCLAPPEAMQFGHALQRILQTILHADPRFGPVYLIKVDIADGFYRVWLNTNDIPKLGVIFPTLPHMEPLVAFPLALPMGWNHPPTSAPPPKRRSIWPIERPNTAIHHHTGWTPLLTRRPRSNTLHPLLPTHSGGSRYRNPLNGGNGVAASHTNPSESSMSLSMMQLA